MPSLVRALALRAVLPVVLLTVLAARPASAASQLLAVRVDAQPAGGALVTVQFGGGVPKFHVVGAGTTETSILLDETQLGSQLAPIVAGTPPITSVTLTQTGSSSAISLHLAIADPVRVQPTGNALVIYVVPTNTPTPAPFGGFGAPPPLAPGGPTVTEVVMLKYADVSEIADALVSGANVASNDNFSPINTNFGTSSSFGSSFGGSSFPNGGLSTQSGGTFGGAFGANSGLAQKVSENVAVDRRLNAVILTGSQEVVDGLKAIVDKLDVPLPSVILEAEILELTDSDAKEIGIDFAPSGNGLVVNGATSPAGYTVKTLQTGQGEIDFGANLYAEIDKDHAKVLAQPRILAQSGSSASILTGDELPIITNIVIGGATATVQQQVNYVNVGVNLQIQPRVSSDGMVTSHIFSEVSSVTSYVQGIPEISQRQAQTIATVRDGQSFIIGGLLQDNEINDLEKLPFVGDLPLIGTFFRHITTSHQMTNLYILVTPHIVQPGGPAAGGQSGVPARYGPPPGGTPAPSAPPAPGGR